MKTNIIEQVVAASLLMASTTMAHYPISACEQTETTYVYGGNQYKICPASDYQGTTLWAYHSIASPGACAQQCQQYQGCVRAVYDTVGGSCYMKAPPSALNWVADDQGLVTIRFDKSWPTGGAPATCPFEVKTYTSTQGWQYTVCPGSDYQGNTISDNWGITSDQECADACGNSASCFKALYDPVAQVCRFKSSCNVNLVSNPDTDTIMFVNRPNTPSCSSTTTSCTTATAKSSRTTFLTTARVSKSTTISKTPTRTQIFVTTSKSTTLALTTPSTTITITPATTTSTATTAATGVCPNGAAPDSTYTASNGDVYGICKNIDFPGGDIGWPVYSVATIQACADACTLTNGCVAANLQRDAQVCYLKGVQNSAVSNTAVDAAYLVKAGNKVSPSTTATQSKSDNTPTTTAKTQTTSATICQGTAVTVTVTATVTQPIW